jgi:DNA repair exonuclease SbcCD nuclease subunit
MRHAKSPAAAGVRFLHTADLQLGKPFQSIPGDAGAKLRERRLDAIDVLAKVARDHEADLVVVAGDFFDANTAPDRLVQQVFSRIRQAEIPFLVLPGNHDHAGTGSVYARPSFRKECPKNLTVLALREPVVVLGGRAVILPAPLYRQRELGDPTAHLTPDFGQREAPGAIRIGVAHGSLMDVGRDVDGRAPNLIPGDRAERGALHYLALGDWHGMKKVSERAWYSGTPEPTGFRQNDPGFALMVEIAAAGAPPCVQPIRVATTRWLEHRTTACSGEDVQRLAAWFEALEAPQDVIGHLEVEGALPRLEMERLEHLLQSMSHRLLHLKLSSRVRASLTEADLSDIAVDGAVRTAIDRLRALAASSDTRARAADRALHTLHRLALAQGDSAC